MGQVTAPKQIAELLNNQFRSVFTREDLYAMRETPVSSFPPSNDVQMVFSSFYLN